MDLSLVLVGFSKLAFGIVLGSLGVTMSARLVKRAVGLDAVDDAIREGNSAVGLALASAIVAMGLLIMPCVTAIFSAFELMRHALPGGTELLWILAYVFGLSVAALLVGSAVIGIGVRAAVRLTPDIDEIQEIREGNLSSALVLAAILIVLALVAREGLETFLTGFLPLPTLGRDFPN